MNTASPPACAAPDARKPPEAAKEARPGGGLLDLGREQYERFSHLVEEHSGLSFPESRRLELEAGVRQAFAASTCTDLDDYYRLLLDPVAGKIELDRLINAVTVNETHFFRDAAQFDALYDHVLPQLIERKRPLRTLRIWSAGCATGEEAFSIALCLRELLPDVDDWAITILGTDINTEALARARQGVYGDWAFREDRAKDMRLRYFRACGARYELLPEVRSMVTFARLNLAESIYPAYESNTMLMDLILCRNVTIYFREAVTHRVVERFYEALLEGGWLAVGHSEPSPFTYQKFQAHILPNTVLYQRNAQPTTLPGDSDAFGGKASSSFLSAGSRTLSSGNAECFCAPSGAHKDTYAPDGRDRLGDDGGGPVAAVRCDGDAFEYARELIDYGHSEEARTVLLELVTRDPSRADAYALLGQVCANAGRWSDAESWCRRAVAVDNLRLDAYYTLALVMQHQGEVEAAIEALRKVVYIDHDYVLGHYGLADLYHAAGSMLQALKSLDNALRLLERGIDHETIPGSGGITVGRLRETVMRQQQQWRAEVDPLLSSGR